MVKSSLEFPPSGLPNRIQFPDEKLNLTCSYHKHNLLALQSDTFPVSSVCLSLVSNAKGANRRSQTRAGKTIKVIEKQLFNTGGNAKRFLRLSECRSCSASLEILISANSKLSVHKHQRQSLPRDRVLSD